MGEAAVSIKYGKFPHPLTPSRMGRGDFKKLQRPNRKTLNFSYFFVSLVDPKAVLLIYPARPWLPSVLKLLGVPRNIC